MRRTLLLDLDGTLLDTSERHYRVYRDILSFLGVSHGFAKEAFWNLKRQGKRTVDLLPEGLSGESVEVFTGEWLKRIERQEYLQYDTVFQDSKAIVSLLNQEDDVVLITLRNSRENLMQQLQATGLIGFFKDVLVGSPLKLKKKAPLIEGYRDRCKHESLFAIVGDSEMDVIAGKEMGIVTVALCRGIRSRGFLEKLKPDFCLDDLAGVAEALACRQ